MRVAQLVLGAILATHLALCGTPEKSSVLSLQVSAQVGAEAWPLHPEHLAITCDGNTIPPTALRRVDAPISVGIVVQPSKYLQEHAGDVQAALRVLLGQIRQGDETFTVNSLERPALGVRFTADTGAVASSVAMPTTKLRSHLYDGVDFALDYLANARNFNKALVVIFSNDDLASATTAKLLRAKILSAHIPTYVVSLYARNPDDTAPTQYELTRIAVDSGGDIWAVMKSSKLPDVMAGVHIRPGYVLDLNPAEQCRPNATHALNMRWNPGVAHSRVLLRYQHKLPDR